MAKIKNKLDGINNRLEKAEERITSLEAREYGK